MAIPCYEMERVMWDYSGLEGEWVTAGRRSMPKRILEENHKNADQ
jgi:hypothetical protein